MAEAGAHVGGGQQEVAAAAAVAAANNDNDNDNDNNNDDSFALQEGLAEVEAELDAMRGDRESLRARLDGAEAAAAAFADVRAERLALEVRVAELETQLAAARATASAAASAAAAEKNALAAERDAALEQYTALQAMCASIEVRAEAAEARAGLRSEAERSQAERSVILAQEERNIMRARLTLVEAQLLDAQAAADTAATAAANRHRMLEAQNERLAAQLAELAAANASSRSMSLDETSGHEALAAALETKNAELARVRSQNAALRESLAAAEADAALATPVGGSDRPPAVDAPVGWASERASLLQVIEEQTSLLTALEAELAAGSGVYSAAGDPRYNPAPIDSLTSGGRDELSRMAAGTDDEQVACAGAVLDESIAAVKAKVSYLESAGWHVPAAGHKVSFRDDLPTKFASPVEALEWLRELLCEAQAVVQSAKAYRNDLSAALHEKHLLLERMYADYAEGGMGGREPSRIRCAKVERALRVTEHALRVSRASEVKPEYLDALHEIRAGVVGLVRALDVADLRRATAKAVEAAKVTVLHK
ncbi:uncharacterized protein AMSG_00416 [Thecamonas trahens ATCC 50062]|uniref:Uncharacterized protein n=1 Tax=Thecamonas trahens ATCC 50062 TaxID=461836 RepID=A0A0L0D8H6_THETB|nr:hypothetical protein AMSG_00416 [Thecamonas trahens ATCC 50062]KNC48639.1 hypothetical protein AMSG_00416 [Thecamonas trahens ATCC 50062]|eukprot:XP_013762695.1 hypothetical protein AMSG_00416 [Thecamonas trahens ATCC 50062]